MTGKTHLVCGEAAALLLLRPAGPQELLLTLAAAAVGATLPDVDVTSSDARERLVGIVSIAGGAALVVWAVNTLCDLHLEQRLPLLAGQARLWAWVVLFLALCVFGSFQPHRSFLHSVPGVALLTACVHLGAQPLAPAFFVAILSHVLLDLLNKRPVRLLFPLRRGVCLGLCSSGGLVNRQLFLWGSVAAGVGVLLAAGRCLGWL